MLRAAVRRWVDRTAFVHHDVELSFTELGRRAHAVAAGLAERGIGRGDVVAVHLPNCLQYPAVYYGVLMAGAVLVIVPVLLVFALLQRHIVAGLTQGAVK